MRALVLVSAATLAAIAACASEPPNELTSSGGPSAGSTSGVGAGMADASSGTTGTNSTGAGGQDGRAFFDANVSPILDDGIAGATCAECHSAEYPDDYDGPDFLGGGPEQFYDNLVGEIIYVNADPGNSQFLNRGLHTGPAFTPAQAETVRAWLAIEAENRFGTGGDGGAGGAGGGTTGPTGPELLDQFSECMTLEDWKATGMQQIALQVTLQDGPCHKCHESGVGANFMTSPLNEAQLIDGFEKERHMPFIQNLVTWTVDQQTGQVSGLEQSYRWRDKGSEGTAHPKFLLLGTYQESIDAWFELTYSKCFGGGEGGAGGAGGAGGGQ
jgi:mono/diheme cytochrome c family protein